MKSFCLILSLVFIFSHLSLQATVQPDNNAASGVLQSMSSASLSNFMVPSGSNRLLVVSSAHDQSPISNIIYNGQNLSQACVSAPGIQDVVSEIWYLPLGDGGSINSDIVITYTGMVAFATYGASSFQNVLQSTPVGNTDSRVIGDGETSSSLTVPISGNANLVVDNICQDIGGDLVVGPGQSIIWTNSFINLRDGSSYESETGPSVEMSWSWPTSTNGGVHCAVELRCAPAIPTLSQWGIIVLSICLLLIGTAAARQSSLIEN